MLKVTKRKNNVSATDDLIFQTKNKLFRMSYEGNLDIYWSMCGTKYDRVDGEYGYYEFLITKENYSLYEAFNLFYERIIEAQLFGEVSLTDFTSLAAYEKEQKRHEKWRQDMLKSNVYHDLVHDGVITWLSDDAIMDENDALYFLFPPAYVTIKKINDAISIEFKVKLIKGIRMQPATIRIRTNGSAYQYFYVPFMLLHQALQNYEKTPQIHIEEYLYRCRKKEK